MRVVVRGRRMNNQTPVTDKSAGYLLSLLQIPASQPASRCAAVQGIASMQPPLGVAQTTVVQGMALAQHVGGQQVSSRSAMNERSDM